MNSCLRRLLLRFTLLSAVSFSFYTAADTNRLVIENFHDGLLTWSCAKPFPYYHVEWTTNLSAPWLPGWERSSTCLPLDLSNAMPPTYFFRVVGTSNSYYFNGMAARWTGNGNLAAMAGDTNGNTIVALTQTNADGNVIRVAGGVWNPQSATPLVVYAGTNGYPERAVLGEYIFLFANYSSNTVDIAMVTPYGTNAIVRQVPLPAYATNCMLRPLPSPGTPKPYGPQPKDNPDHYLLHEVLRSASAGLGIAGCVIGSVVTGGLALLPCGAALVSVVVLLVPDDPTLSGTSFALDVIQCVTAPANPVALLDCGSAAIDLADFAIGKADEAQSSNSDPIADAYNDLVWQGLAVSPAALSVAEGGTAPFTVRLISAPIADVTVTTSFASGDTDLSVSSGGSLLFTPQNWNTPQTVTLAAAQDPDAENGEATFTVTSPGLPSVTVTATETDDDPAGPITLFQDNFEDGLQQWTGKSGGSHHGITVPDPLRPGNTVLTFTALNGAGDVFTTAGFSLQPGKTYRLSFDYLGFPQPASVPDDFGGFVGVCASPHDFLASYWYFATIITGSPGYDCGVYHLADDGQWQSYSLLLTDPFKYTPMHLSLEDWNGSGGVPGDALFDNVKLEEL